jgi:glutamine---fructose-6-phosphate transaminase (isomerizing)
MCGIVGYVGPRDALGVILSGLEKLEYRGYDSAGVAVVENGKLAVTRALGKLAALKACFTKRSPNEVAPIGIGHTRWATHGKPSENNAHPHSAGRVSLVHNGIIENYSELRRELEAEGSVFKSETDTEIAAHLLNRALANGLAPFEALKDACARIRGSYAFLALDVEHPESLLVAKSSSPIILGVGQGEMFVASDIPALLNYTRDVVILEDGDLAEISASSIRIENQGNAVDRAIERVTWDPVTAQKGGFPHFMLKEIHDQGTVLADAFRGRIGLETGEIILPEISLAEDEIKSIRRIVFVACGTAWHAALVAKNYIEQIAKIPCEVDYASEFRYRTPVLDAHTLVIAVSQSGETADTLAAIDLAAQRGCKTLAVCNVLGASLVRRVKNVIFTQAGPEISVASTKAFTTQLIALYLFALHLAQLRGEFSKTDTKAALNSLVRLPQLCKDILELSDRLQRIAVQYSKARDMLVLGRGSLYPLALEGALKIKEISYIHAEGYPAGEMKHGPIALIDDQVPVIVLLQRCELLFEKMVSNLREVESRGGKIIALTDSERLDSLKEVAAEIVTLPHLSPELTPILFAIPLQLFAYHLAVARGTDVDLPRNLAKSVTVE